jgi:hypothetical protein
MLSYPSTNILVSPLDDKAIKCLNEIETYLEINGTPYHQNSDNPNRIETHYFMGNSVVRINKFKKKADIKIVSSKEDLLLGMKKSIETMLR